MKLLIIDDSSFSRRKLKEAFLKEAPDLEIIEAHDGEAALQILEVEKPDCCVTDLVMPKLDGVAFLQQVKERDMELKIAVLSADIQESRQQECLALGASAFVEKPITQPKIAQILGSFRA